MKHRSTTEQRPRTKWSRRDSNPGYVVPQAFVAQSHSIDGDEIDERLLGCPSRGFEPRRFTAGFTMYSHLHSPSFWTTFQSRLNGQSHRSKTYSMDRSRLHIPTLMSRPLAAATALSLSPLEAALRTTSVAFKGVPATAALVTIPFGATSRRPETARTAMPNS